MCIKFIVVIVIVETWRAASLLFQRRDTEGAEKRRGMPRFFSARSASLR
jgi:hypothetical protein